MKKSTDNNSLPLLTLPSWLVEHAQAYTDGVDIEQRMAFVIGAARENVLANTGGPFAAGIFEKESGKLVSLGVNLVTSHNNSILHAEVVAIMLAQFRLNTFDLGQQDLPEHDLVSSSAPCAMCQGATNWSGVQRLVYGANITDACATGFDEGPVSSTWQTDLKQRGIVILPEILRQEAIEVLRLYRDRGGILYNGSNGRSSQDK